MRTLCAFDESILFHNLLLVGLLFKFILYDTSDANTATLLSIKIKSIYIIILLYCHMIEEFFRRSYLHHFCRFYLT
jgi:hypothetical protein